MEIKIRKASEGDISGILGIFNEAILNTTSVYDYSPHTLEMKKKWFREKEENNFPVLVSEVNNVIAGFATYGRFRNREAYMHSVEHSVYVHKDYRRLGIARMLLSQLFEIAKKNKIHTIVAGIDSANKVSIEFHKRLGFKEVGFVKEAGYKFGRWLDLVFLHLML